MPDSGPDYTVTDERIEEREKHWLASHGDPAKNLQVHRCLAALLDIIRDKPGDTALNALFDEIGHRVDLSGSDVRKNLHDAEGAGFLRAGGRLSLGKAADLESELPQPADKQRLRVIVGEVDNRYLGGNEDRVRAAAEAAADYFVKVVPPTHLHGEDPKSYTSCWVGVSGGNTMLQVVNHIIARNRRQSRELTVVPLAGEAEPEKFVISANSVALRLAEGCVECLAQDSTGAFSLMTTPIVGIDSSVPDQQQALQHNPGIKAAIAKARHVKFAFTGIGAFRRGGSDALSRIARYCEIPQEKWPNSDKVVGDILYRPIDSQGVDGWSELSGRLVGPDLADLKAMSSQPDKRRVFAVACGRDKAKPVIAAFRAHLVNGLITDELTAEDILEELREQQRQAAVAHARSRRQSQKPAKRSPEIPLSSSPLAQPEPDEAGQP
jgi:DNA-binding transcriptional regulator LsrR (DeoR family)